MAENVIYFPYINVPNNNWFTNILFYWDKVYAIVPNEYHSYPTMLQEYTRTLIAEHLVEPISPMNCIDQIPDFKKRFLKIVDEVIRPNLKKNILDEDCDTAKIHIEKMGELTEDLVFRHLAKPLNYPWYEVEQKTADYFMQYLASEFGKLKKNSAIPITDDFISYELFQIQKQKENELNLICSKIRPVILKSILPTPKKIHDPRDILSFKEDNKDLLINFRNDIENSILHFSTIENINTRNQAISQFKKRKEIEINEIKTQMESRDWKVNLCKFAGYSVASFSVVSALAQNDIGSAVLNGTQFAIPLSLEIFQKNQTYSNSMIYAIRAQNQFQ